jgi:D-tyrosyl-tRNA(Tyr) deacylase
MKANNDVLVSLSIRVFDDSSTGSMWKSSVKDISGDVLCVSQFTLFANTQKGNKPDFHRAMVSSKAFIRIFSLNIPIQRGRIDH